MLETFCAKLASDLRGLINSDHSLSLSHIILLHPRSIPKTTSGKITRAGCRKAFLQKTLKSIYTKSFNSTNNNTNSTNIASFEIHQDHPKSVDPSTIRSLSKKEIKARLTRDIGKIVSMPSSSLPLDTPLATMMDSLSLSQFKGLLEAQYATTFSDEYLFREGSTINKLVEVVKLGFAPDDDTDGTSSPGTGSAAAVPSSGEGFMGCPPGVCCVVM